jgi:hypothetical protein
VAWAGEEASATWFDVGRDYTELWHHQAQERWAVGAPLLSSRRWLHPVLALAVRAMPRALSDVPAEPGATIVLEVEGDAGGVWSASPEEGAWVIAGGELAPASTRLTLDADTAWRLFFHALSVDEARSRVDVAGDPGPAEALLRMRSVMVRPPSASDAAPESAS